MLNLVEVRNQTGSLLALGLEDISQGVYIKEIDGLDPVKAVLVSSSFANMDGEQYQSARREKRNIVIKLALDPDYAGATVRQLRRRLYNFFMPKTAVKLRFWAEGEPTVDIQGRVESFDSPQFTKEPSATISILCFEPDFYDPNPNVIFENSVSTTATRRIEYSGS